MSGLAITITDRGRAALIAARGTNPVTIAQVGVTAANFTASSNTLALPGEIKRLTTFSGEASDAYTVHITIRDDSIDTYELRGFALYLSDGTLFGIYGNGPALIMEKASASMLLLAVDIAFTASDAKQITFGSTNFLNPPATTEREGVVELATDSEATTGTDTIRAVTPKAMLSAVTNWINSRFGNGAPSDFIKGILGSANAAALRTALGLKSAAIKDEGAGGGLDADKLDGQESAYYTNITARLGFTPANKAGDTFTGLTTFNDEANVKGGAGSTNVHASSNFGLAAGFANPVAGRLLFGDGSGWKFHFSRGTASAPTDVMTITDGGRLGLGTTSPAYTLDVVGGTRFGSPTPSHTVTFAYNGATYFWLGNNGTSVAGTGVDDVGLASKGAFAIGANGGNTPHILVAPSGYVGIGTTSPTAQLHIASANVSFDASFVGAALKTTTYRNSGTALTGTNFVIGSSVNAYMYDSVASGTSYLRGVQGSAWLGASGMAPTGVMQEIAGLSFSTYNYQAAGASVLNQYGVFASSNNRGAGAVTNNFGMAYFGYRSADSTSATTNSYGVYVDTTAIDSYVTNNFGVYIKSTSAKNYFGGSVGIGTVPGKPLDVVGDVRSTTGYLVNSNVVWHAGNDGSGSGSDADLLDGQDGSYYADIPSRLGYTPLNAAGGTMSGDLSFGVSMRQMLNLWNTVYGIGVQTNTQYFRSGGAFAWYSGGSHSNTQFDPGTSGTTLMKLTGTTLSVGGNTAWHAGNDGAGSAMDADMVDGKQLDEFIPIASSWTQGSGTHPEATTPWTGDYSRKITTGNALVIFNGVWQTGQGPYYAQLYVDGVAISSAWTSIGALSSADTVHCPATISIVVTGLSVGFHTFAVKYTPSADLSIINGGTLTIVQTA
jgi:hypothetical protein